MAYERLQSALPEGEALRYTTDVREGGSLGLTDERLLLAREEVVSVDLDDVQEVTVQSFDWFLTLLGLALLGFGLLSFQRNVIGGAVFTAAALGSLYLTYRKRNQVDVKVRNRPKPLRFHLDDAEAFKRAYRDRVPEAALGGDPDRSRPDGGNG